MPNGAAAALDRGVREEDSRPGIKANEAIRLFSGLHEPDPVAVVGSHRVRQRGRTAGHRELLDLPACRVEQPQMPACVVHVPEPVVRRDRNATVERLLVRQRIRLQFPGERVDGADETLAEQVEPGAPLRVEHNSVRTGALERQAHDAVLPGRHVEMADDVRVLRGEPEIALVVEHHRVRVLHGRVPDREPGDRPGRRVEPADHAVAVAGEPELPSGIDETTVGERPRVDFEALELARFRVEPRDIVALLADKEDPAVGRYGGVPRAGLFPRHFPLVHRHE